MQGYYIRFTKHLEDAYILAEKDLALGAALLAKTLIYPAEAFKAGIENVTVCGGTDYAPILIDEEGNWIYIKDQTL